MITVEAGVRDGLPCIRGLEISVFDVLDRLASDGSTDEVLRDCPALTRDDLRAACSFAAAFGRRNWPAPGG